MDFVKLSRVNDELKRISTPYQRGGKVYVEVCKRIQGFWQLYPNGRITTRWFALTEDHAICIAEVFDGEVLLTTGTAREDKGAGYVNKTSYVENAETSAVGRALGNLGIGSVDAVASYDEVQNVEQARPKAKATKTEQKTVRQEFVDKCHELGLNPGNEARNLGLTNASTDEDFKGAILYLDGRR